MDLQAESEEGCHHPMETIRTSDLELPKLPAVLAIERCIELLPEWKANVVTVGPFLKGIVDLSYVR
jgi:hypothetical protein